MGHSLTPTLCTTQVLGNPETMPGAHKQPWPATSGLRNPVLRAGSSAHQAHELVVQTPASHSSQLRAWPGKISRLSCFFSSVLCTHARSTLPRPWVQGLFIAHQQTRGWASIASWPGWAKQSEMLRCGMWGWGVGGWSCRKRGVLGGRVLGKGKDECTREGETPPRGLLQASPHRAATAVLRVWH